MTGPQAGVVPNIKWRHYDRIEPGVYTAYCRLARTYRDPGYRRWTCLLVFDVFAAGLMDVVARVPLWLNLGSGEEPHAGRRRRYFREWVRANGEPPKRQDRLSPRVFTGRMAHVRVGDTTGDASYSTVQEILGWDTGSPRGHSVNIHTSSLARRNGAQGTTCKE